MNQLFNTRKPVIAAIFTLMIAGLLMACGPAPATPMPRPTIEKGELAEVPPPTPSTPATPTPPPSIIAPDDGCVECHTDQEKLIATAEEEDHLSEELSEGEG